MATKQIDWQHESVVKFAGGQDPILKMESVAREAALEAIENGWSGPPYDPIEMAEIRNISLRPNASIADARVFVERDKFLIEYNPNGTKGRVNFSIAHEIAHTFFDDCADAVRHRSKEHAQPSNWQLEVLCNIGAAEILMPVGSLHWPEEKPHSIESLMELRKKYQVSAEAMLIRATKLSSLPMMCFAASRERTSSRAQYRIDYSIASPKWKFTRLNGIKLRASKVLDECVAIGTTSKGTEKWTSDLPKLRIEAVALPPYPGQQELRVVGIARPLSAGEGEVRQINYLQGDASQFARKQNCAILHVVNNRARSWGGMGFAGSLKRRYPQALKEYREWVCGDSQRLRLGNFHKFSLPHSRYIISMVAQSGYGPSVRPRLRYGALDRALERAAIELAHCGVTCVQMPRIGAGQAGGAWGIIEGIILERLVSSGFEVRVYDRPPD